MQNYNRIQESWIKDTLRNYNQFILSAAREKNIVSELTEKHENHILSSLTKYYLQRPIPESQIDNIETLQIAQPVSVSVFRKFFNFCMRRSNPQDNARREFMDNVAKGAKLAISIPQYNIDKILENDARKVDGIVLRTVGELEIPLNKPTEENKLEEQHKPLVEEVQLEEKGLEIPFNKPEEEEQYKPLVEEVQLEEKGLEIPLNKPAEEENVVKPEEEEKYEPLIEEVQLEEKELEIPLNKPTEEKNVVKPEEEEQYKPLVEEVQLEEKELEIPFNKPEEEQHKPLIEEVQLEEKGLEIPLNKPTEEKNVVEPEEEEKYEPLIEEKDMSTSSFLEYIQNQSEQSKVKGNIIN